MILWHDFCQDANNFKRYNIFRLDVVNIILVFLQRCRFATAQEDLGVAVADDGIRIVLIDCFEL